MHFRSTCPPIAFLLHLHHTVLIHSPHRYRYPARKTHIRCLSRVTTLSSVEILVNNSGAGYPSSMQKKDSMEANNATYSTILGNNWSVIRLLKVPCTVDRK